MESFGKRVTDRAACTRCVKRRLDGRERGGGLQSTFFSMVPSWQVAQSLAAGQIGWVESRAPA